MKAEIGDYIRKDGVFVKVIGYEWGISYLTSDGGCIADNEIEFADVLLESEYEELYL